MEFDHIVVKESPGLCRCCLSEGCYKDLAAEYIWMNETEVYADMLLECFDISISQHSDGPNGMNRLICEVCITRLRDACNFKKQVLDSEKKFVDMLGRGEFAPKVLLYENQLKTETDPQVGTSLDEVEVEYLEDLDFGDDDDVKNEDSEVDTSDITVSALPTRKRGRPPKIKSNKEKKLKSSTSVEKSKTSKAASKDENTGSQVAAHTCEQRRNNMVNLFNNTSVIPFKWRGNFLCFYCGNSFTDIPDFRKHTKSHEPCSSNDYSLKKTKGNDIEIKLDISEIKCELCCENFEKVSEIVMHLTGKHGIEYNENVDMSFKMYRLSDMTCIDCGEQFDYFGYLVSHVNTKHPENCFICDNCGSSFNKKRDLAFHQRNSHKIGGYKCKICSEVFKTMSTMRQHHKIHFQSCSLCDLSYSSRSLLVKHIESNHPENDSHKCMHCFQQFHSALGLRQHSFKCKAREFKISDSGFQLKEIVQPKKKQNVDKLRKNIQCILNMSTVVPFKYFSKFGCFYCAKKFIEMNDVRIHTESEHPVCELKCQALRVLKGERNRVKIDITSLACRACFEKFDTLDSLIDHLILSHKVEYDKSISCLEPYKVIKENIPCLICNENFRYFGRLLRHMNVVHSNNFRICDFCGQSFRNIANLRMHVLYNHTGGRECDVCRAKFKNQACLARHKAKKHDAKDFKCSKCPELFSSQYQRQKHLIKAHDTGHKCDYCGRMFTRNSFMKDHIRRTHLKEKKVPCSVCNEKFFDNYLLRMHMVKHDGERKFTCEVCGKAFLRRSNLHSHMDMHKKYGHVQIQAQS